MDGVGVSVSGGGKITAGPMMIRPIIMIITINPAVTPPIFRIVRLLTPFVFSGGASSRDPFTSSMISCTCSAVNPLTIWVPITEPVTRISFSSPKFVPPEPIRLRQFRKNKVGKLDFGGFLYAITFSNVRYSYLALEHIINYNLLIASQDTEKGLEAFIQELEYTIRAGIHQNSLSDSPEDFVSWLTQYKRLYTYGMRRFGNTLAEWENALYDGPPSPSKARAIPLDGLGGPSYSRWLECYRF